MKRALLWILAVMMTVSLLACGAEKEEKQPAKEEDQVDVGVINDSDEDEGVINFDDLLSAAS